MHRSVALESAQNSQSTQSIEVHDVLIIGGGVIGSAIAYFLAANHGVRATVIERDPTYAKASSALSASSIRQQFSTPANIALSQWSFEFLQHAHETLAVNGDAPELSLVERGYLYLATDQGVTTLRENHATQIACGADIRWLDAKALGAQFPWLATDGLVAGTWGTKGEGWFDGPALLQAFRKKAISLGARYVHDEIQSIQHQSDSPNYFGRSNNKNYFSKTIVFATGAHLSRAICGLVGAYPISAKKRDVFVFDSHATLANCPLVIDPSGLWFRPEGTPFADGKQRFLCGAPPRIREGLPHDPDDAPLDDIDYGLFDEFIWPMLAARVPQFEALKFKSAWAGYYEMNAFDHNGLVGALPGHEHCFVAAGFSGHGMQHAPAIGNAVAKLIMGLPAPEVVAFTPARIAKNEPVVERNVI
jgi:FAD-dependent oxidoreductase domain-containing protein 1